MNPEAPDWTCIRRDHARKPIYEFALVLTAVAIDNEVKFEAGEWCLWVPATQVDYAEDQLARYRRENQPVRFTGLPLVTIDSGWAGVWGYLLVIWLIPALAGYGVLDEGWRGDGRLQAGLVAGGEWWRTVTALTLHADLAHIVANSLFGAVFGLFVGRFLGSGFGWLLVLVCGAFGNALNAALRPETFSSIGASTATFAALALGASFVWRRGYFAGRGWRRAFAPVFGGIALLAFTGVGGERTDVLAHFMGFGAGVVGGILAGSFDIRRLGRSGQYIAAGAALGLIAAAWSRALT
jgi:membrane associated rhomboid family serine protease